MNRQNRVSWIIVIGFLLSSFNLQAEPYLAIKAGLHCNACHVSPGGGGMRTEFGQAFGRNLSVKQDSAATLKGQLSEYLRFGGDFRGGFTAIDNEDNDSQSEFSTDQTTLYINADLIPARLNLLVDQQLSPNSLNREAWVRLNSEDQQHYVRAGKIILPFGLRLADDSAFIRQVSGINFSTADNAVEYGWYRNAWNLQLAVGNGSAGAAELDNDKQLSSRLAYVRPDWRLGASVNINNSDSGDREMWNLFGGFNALQSQWLFEFDQIKDSNTDDITQQVIFLEVNHEVAVGHNLKLTLESHDPDTSVSEDDRVRNSIVWEYFPMPLLQLGTGLRISEGIPQKPQDNRDELFFNLHAWF